MGEAKRRGPVPEGERRGKPERWIRYQLNRFLLSPDKLSKARGHKRSRLPKRERAHIKRDYRREHGLNRRQAGAMGAGHLAWPAEGGEE